MAAHKCKFTPGDKVSHPAAPDNSFPAGTGTVESCEPSPGGGYDVKVKCDQSGSILEFKDADLKAVK